MTDIQKQVREDVTRYRYGDEQHLEEALDKIFRFGKAGGVPRKNAPVLVGIREELQEGRYALVLEFESKLEWDKWEERQSKFASFFGPGEQGGRLERVLRVVAVGRAGGGCSAQPPRHPFSCRPFADVPSPAGPPPQASRRCWRRPRRAWTCCWWDFGRGAGGSGPGHMGAAVTAQGGEQQRASAATRLEPQEGWPSRRPPAPPHPPTRWRAGVGRQRRGPRRRREEGRAAAAHARPQGAPAVICVVCLRLAPFSLAPPPPETRSRCRHPRAWRRAALLPLHGPSYSPRRARAPV
jgi:hypothetical protein